MAKIPIDRETKVMFLKWLKEGAEESEIWDLRHKFPTTDEENEQFGRDVMDALHDNGECEIICRVGKCYPAAEPDFYRNNPYRL